MRYDVKLIIERKPPPTLNRITNMHWATRRKLKKLWEEEVAVAALNAGRPKFKRTEVQIVLYYAQKRKRDQDNLMGSAGKLLLDGLRYAGVIPDDDMQTISLPEIMVKIDRKNPRVEIWLRELAG